MKFSVSPKVSQEWDRYAGKATEVSGLYLSKINQMLLEKKRKAEKSRRSKEEIVIVTELMDETPIESDQETEPTDQKQELQTPTDDELSTVDSLEPLQPVASDAVTSKRRSFQFGRGEPSTKPQIPAQIDETIAPRCQLGEASIEGDFTTIQYGIHNGRAACQIILDFRLVFQPSSTINWAQMKFRFGSESESNVPQASKTFFPEELTGQYDTAQDIRAYNPNVGLGAAGCRANVGGISMQQARITRRQWRVQGTREAYSDGYDTFCWKVLENELSQDSVPRRFQVGMIVYLPDRSEEHDARFWVDVSIEGTIRGLWSKHKKVKARRWFEPSAADLESDITLTEDTPRVVSSAAGTTAASTPVLAHEEAKIESMPALPALPAATASNVDVPKKPSDAKPSDETHQTSYGAAAAYEYSGKDVVGQDGYRSEEATGVVYQDQMGPTGTG
ncbi:hypothetical protein LTR09_002874 [Extremus antarcticus]|uniref:Uncharacterized protein n=1 Tax=Extremus antarcticus TaxID=702011 RepID=A0AAJ0GF71_9PEZI|nr:hypothetical protein LTR09_002874 [Extremus antarcticus]